MSGREMEKAESEQTGTSPESEDLLPDKEVQDESDAGNLVADDIETTTVDSLEYEEEE
jgi:hypothetical protein